MASFERWVDRLIRGAQERGEFDNLPGKGKPLKLDDDALSPPDWRLANRLLKNAGFAPDWIESEREIRLALEAARAALLRSFQWRADRLAALGDRRDLEAQRERDAVSGERSRAVHRFTEAVGQINRQIDTFNLKAPALHLQRPRLNAASELERLERGEGPEATSRP